MMKITQEILNTLTEAAKRASRNAHVPYSRFPVGAAVLIEDGDIYVGCNVENASFGLTNCAERSAIFSAVTDGCGPGDFEAILLYTPGKVNHPPCGACRQVISEFFPADAMIYSTCDSGRIVSWTLEGLLPDSFMLPEIKGEED